MWLPAERKLCGRRDMLVAHEDEPLELLFLSDPDILCSLPRFGGEEEA